ncbi:hypothetical protein ABZ816_14050 [Actinosynnema sp. NPDC047251]|uniref:Uncharacterized protein n=1 Tax=Saccharothrix espanaensis (strain ATCC 51144 / DSM 44229 / JCM 9112 / NBRC 15066 / NRRL 15764) TaxID=1179773 RepID=K0KGT6_SACES|nr:hypothetical protein [Saccharothrix espanaensis]CCH35723.1 hypothetical protein BN6_85090 [Saccharothrix espanaensis DSM 44229]
MTWAQTRIVTSLGLHLDDSTSVDLRAGQESSAFLTIGNGIEITLSTSHVRTLFEQAADVLGDIGQLERAGRVLEDAYHAGAQARTAGESAARQAEVAGRAGAHEQADAAREAARNADDAAGRAQAAVRIASEAMDVADDAAAKARQAATTAAEAALSVVCDDPVTRR